MPGPLYYVQPDVGPAKITVTAAGGSSKGTTADPLTAAFEGLPVAHDGETAFTFRIVFSEAVAVTAEAMRTRVLTVTGGAVTGAARVDGEIGVWAIAVTPDSREELSIALAPTEDCAADGAVCTSDGRALSSGAAAIVFGPPERNTAATGTPAISGTPQVGEELTASTSGISDSDGLDDARFAHDADRRRRVGSAVRLRPLAAQTAHPRCPWVTPPVAVSDPNSFEDGALGPLESDAERGMERGEHEPRNALRCICVNALQDIHVGNRSAGA